MKPRISRAGKKILKDPSASHALVEAIIANPEAFANGNEIEVVLPKQAGKNVASIFVKQVTAR